jgi:hypothetical protein
MTIRGQRLWGEWMRMLLKTARVGVVALLCFAFGSACAAESREQCQAQFSPQSGQPGKDVIWVPTPDSLVTAMLRAAGTTPKDHVIDLGSGDGKIPIAAAKEFGATAVGIEYNPDMVKLSQCYAKVEGVQDKVKFIQGDIFEVDFSAATVLTMYLLPDLNEKLKPTILRMRPGTRVVSHSFLMGDWRPDERLEEGQAYLWIVPAKVGGNWYLEPNDGSKSLRLTLEQTYQDIAGTLSIGKHSEPLREAMLRGDQIAFLYIGPRGQRIEFKGRVQNDQLQLTALDGRKRITYAGRRA